MQLLENYLVEIEYHTIYGNLMRSRGGKGKMKMSAHIAKMCVL